AGRHPDVRGHPRDTGRTRALRALLERGARVFRDARRPDRRGGAGRGEGGRLAAPDCLGSALRERHAASGKREALRPAPGRGKMLEVIPPLSQGWSSMRSLLCTAVICLLASAPVRAGLHYSGEEFSPLPSQWRGFLLDQRQLRLVAFPGMPKTPATALRVRYEKAAAELEKTARSRALSADERADLGAILVRLGNLPRALTVLREAHGLHPRHYRITSNLG